MGPGGQPETLLDRAARLRNGHRDEEARERGSKSTTRLERRGRTTLRTSSHPPPGRARVTRRRAGHRRCSIATGFRNPTVRQSLRAPTAAPPSPGPPADRRFAMRTSRSVSYAFVTLALATATCVDPGEPRAGRTNPNRRLGGHRPVGFRRRGIRQRAHQPDRDGVRPRRPPVRRPAGRAAAGHQERRAAADAVPHRDRQLDRRARPARRRLRSRLRDQPVRLRLLHGHHARDSQPRQPVHRQRRRRRGRQRGRPPRPREPEQRHQPQRRRDALRPRRQALRRRRRKRQRRQLPRR